MLMRSPLARERPSPAGFIRPAQPVVADRPPAGPGWSFEIKHDGFRIVARKDGELLRLCSRNARDWSVEFRAIAEALRALPFSSVILDGEAVAHCDKGLPDFHGLLGDGAASACFYAFRVNLEGELSSLAPIPCRCPHPHSRWNHPGGLPPLDDLNGRSDERSIAAISRSRADLLGLARVCVRCAQ
jgi:hypothetical protein